MPSSSRACVDGVLCSATAMGQGSIVARGGRRSSRAQPGLFVSDDEGPIQECQIFHLDIASYCGLDDCPVTAPSPRCERDATRTKTQKQKGRGKRARSADVRSARAMAASSKRHHATTSASASLCAAAGVGKRSGASSA